jgi:hypothetical protein
MLKEMASELNHLNIEKDGIGFALSELETLAKECQEEEDEVMEEVPAQQDSGIGSSPVVAPVVKSLIVEL